MDAGKFLGAINSSRNRVNGVGHSHYADSPWRKFNDDGPGVGAPWLCDQRPYLNILGCKDIDNRTEWENHHLMWEAEAEQERLEREEKEKEQQELREEDEERDREEFYQIVQTYEESVEEMNRVFNGIELERRVTFDERFNQYYGGVSRWFRKMKDHLYSKVRSKVRAFFARGYPEKIMDRLMCSLPPGCVHDALVGYIYGEYTEDEDWDERKWRLENGLDEVDERKECHRMDEFTEDWHHPPYPPYPYSEDEYWEYD